ncbi:MAG: GNAT family N-acetyltransferase [Verrucomicrobiota bacterium]
MPVLTVIRSRDQFSSLREEWDDLIVRADRNWPFLTWAYLDAAWNRFCSDGDREALVLICRTNSGQLCGGLPLMFGYEEDRVRKYLLHLSFLGMRFGQTGDWHAVLSSPDQVEAVAETFADAITGPLSADWHILSMMPVLAGCPASQAFFSALQKRDVSIHEEDDFPSPFLDLSHGWDVTRQNNTKKLRKNLRNAHRRTVETHSKDFLEGGKEIEFTASIELIQLIQHARWGYGPEVSGKYDLFHEDIANLHIQRGEMFSLILRFDEEAAAGLFGYLYGEKFWGVMIGRNLEYSDLSPGHQLMWEALERISDRGIKEFDFLGGGGDYKRRWAKESRAFCRYSGVNPSSMRGKAFHHALSVKHWAIDRARRGKRERLLDGAPLPG